MGAFSKALSSVCVPVAEQRNKPFHFSGIDDGSSGARASIQLLISPMATLQVWKWKVEREIHNRGPDVAMRGVNWGHHPFTLHSK